MFVTDALRLLRRNVTESNEALPHSLQLLRKISPLVGAPAPAIFQTERQATFDSMSFSAEIYHLHDLNILSCV